MVTALMQEMIPAFPGALPWCTPWKQTNFLSPMPRYTPSLALSHPATPHQNQTHAALVTVVIHPHPCPSPPTPAHAPQTEPLSLSC